ncbi:MAG: acetylxylan esterase, partial [Clostridia bacterium]|nr:acetylxylan esterase [Clostridia bacterium]
MNSNFKRLLAALLALCTIVTTFTFTVAAAEYPDISTVTSATISEIKVNEPLGYKVGQDIVFKFQIKGDSSVVIAPYLYYSAVMDDGRTLTGYVEPVDGAYTVTLEGGLLRPGFVLMTVNACDANKSTLSVPAAYKCGAGAGIDDIQSIYGMPDEYSTHGDFDAFWDKTLEQLDADGGEATIQYIYYCGEYTFSGVTYDCYDVEINCPKDSYYDSINGNWCGTNHTFAYLTIPKGKTDLGFLLQYKGYDWILSAESSYTNITPTSAICDPNKIILSVSPHSIPAPHNVANETNTDYLTTDAKGVSCYKGTYYTSTLKSLYGYTDTHGKNTSENASPYTTYFKYMILRDVQAVNFLKMYFGSTGVSSTVNGVNTSAWAGLWDGTNIKTSGGSQGGFQAIAVAGLVPEVNEVYAGVPWFADQGVTSADSDRYKPTSPRNFPYGEGLRYMDTANLAARINPDCDVTINAGLIDTLVPPSTVM